MTTPHGPPMLQTLLTRLQGCRTSFNVVLVSVQHMSRHLLIYVLMVGPVMEYASVGLDPYYQTQISILEKVQRSAARWVLSDYSYHSSVSAMLEQLN